MTGYNNVRIEDMSRSFRSGLAFCAILHHFRPELVDYDSLDPEDILQNNSLAFRLAETELGIASLLDPQVSVTGVSAPLTASYAGHGRLRGAGQVQHRDVRVSVLPQVQGRGQLQIRVRT